MEDHLVEMEEPQNIPIVKGKKKKKCVAFGTTTTPTATTSTASISNLRTKLRDNAKVTVAKIQELTVDLLAMDQKFCYGGTRIGKHPGR